VGAALPRRLIPGVVQTTGNAGYYTFYAYLLAKWEDEHESVRRSDVKPFYSRSRRSASLSVRASKSGQPVVDPVEQVAENRPNRLVLAEREPLL
jgi:hypothetical protein